LISLAGRAGSDTGVAFSAGKRHFHTVYPRLLQVPRTYNADLDVLRRIWTCIDDNEGHYLKVVMDEVFGRRNFVATAVWQKRTSPDARLQFSGAHDQILIYGKNADSYALNYLPIPEKQRRTYKTPDNDPRGPWVSSDYSAQGYRPNQMYTITTPLGFKHKPPPGMCWKNVEEVFLKLVADNRIWFGKNGKGVPRRKTFLSESEGRRAWSWWEHEEVGHNQEAKQEINQLFGTENTFDTPKPERLIRQMLTISTNPGDLVLDSFLGSGTTVAVAHKMGRRWIGIEIGAHAETHCIPRLEKVVAGEQGGISESVGWKGGGGYHFYRLGATVRDEAGRLNPKIRFAQLAAHIWFSATGKVLAQRAKSPLLGAHDGKAYYLLYNGILGDRRPDGGNVLTRRVLRDLPAHPGPKVIYGESNLLGAERMRTEQIEFRQIPYDIKER
jgi:adenine-specific DNA-methyltransferase